MKKIVSKCQICNSKLFKFLDLGLQPLCDDLKKTPKSNKLYKTKIIYCKKCLTAYQKYNVDRKKLFHKDYHYRASNTKDVLRGMKELVVNVSKYKNLKNCKVLDIGCNDGSLLDFFKKSGSKTYGIEPTGAYKEAKKKGHIIFNKFFDLNFTSKFKKNFGDIDIITFTNVFAHIENFNDLIKSLKNIITKKTIIVIENHYLGEVLMKNQFDTFYHEHPRTYSLNSFHKISSLLNLNIIDYRFVKRYNGNIQVLLGNFENKNINKKIKYDLRKEFKILNKISLFQHKINTWRKRKLVFLKNIKNKFGPVPAKAFPGRASIIVNFLKLNKNYISTVYEKNNSLKVNKFVPGTDIIILKEKFFKKNEKNKSVIINFAWHISAEIKKYMHTNLKFNGKVIDIIQKKDFK